MGSLGRTLNGRQISSSSHRRRCSSREDSRGCKWRFYLSSTGDWGTEAGISEPGTVSMSNGPCESQLLWAARLSSVKRGSQYYLPHLLQWLVPRSMWNSVWKSSKDWLGGDDGNNGHPCVEWVFCSASRTLSIPHCNTVMLVLIYLHYIGENDEVQRDHHPDSKRQRQNSHQICLIMECKYFLPGQVFGLAVKMPLEMPTTHISVRVWVLALLLIPASC